MSGFNYNNFRAAVKQAEDDKHAKLMDDVDKVKAFVEKGLTMFLESNANMARTSYPGVDI